MDILKKDIGCLAENDFPILCETCLGPNPYVKMSKQEFGASCKICTAPFNLFRWRPSKDSRFKRTEICPKCAKSKNVCQTCIHDLQFGLPVQIRDRIIEENGGIENLENHPMIKDLERKKPNYEKNKSRICSFFVKGKCTRGEECPYRHELPTNPDDPLSNQNLSDRFEGKNDPVAEKYLKKYQKSFVVNHPKDTSIMTLYIGGLTNDIDEVELIEVCSRYGQISSLKLIKNQHCAFVTFSTRRCAESMMEKTKGRVYLHDRKLKILWGKSKAEMSTHLIVSNSNNCLAPVPGLPVALGDSLSDNNGQTTTTTTTISKQALDMKIYYPSMDPNYYGSKH